MSSGKMFIDGQWLMSKSGKTRELYNPSNGQLLGSVSEGNAEDAGMAVDAASNAFTAWRRTSPAQRAALLNEAARLVDMRAEEIAQTECANSGRLLRVCISDVATVSKAFRFFAGIIDIPSGQTFNGAANVTTINIREPIGVCGLIIPWNAPINIASKCIAPALAAGNTIVLKPSSMTPLATIMIVECLEQAGFPKGVVNLVLGSGEVIGTELGQNEKLGKVTLTGGTETGRSLIRASASNIKKLSLELGGKSAIMVFDDADIDLAIDNIMFIIFSSAGQLCVAGTRILVQDGIYTEFCRRLVERVNKIRVGPSNLPDTEMGPVISQAQLKRICNYIEIGKREGATLAAGGNVLTGGIYERGNYVAPTIFTDCGSDMRISREEIFGPVLAVAKFTDEQEAFDIANDSIYGLGAGIYTKDSARSWRFAKEVKAACMWVNTYGTSAGWGSPISCLKQSGYSTLLGVEGLEAYMDIKQISFSNSPAKFDWFKG
ncbi:MAG: aldehyde dehydrogenase family protein [Oscillospiraceae bacterium]